MEDMGNYFGKWSEWRNTDLVNKSSTSINRAENDEAKDIQTSNQSNQQPAHFNLIIGICKGKQESLYSPIISPIL